MPVELFLSVPQMWRSPANRRMTMAAKRAGVPYVELVYEPQCAVAFYTYKIRSNKSAEIKTGQIVLVADIGGGTGDFASYELTSDSSTGASVGLALVGVAKGEQPHIH